MQTHNWPSHSFSLFWGIMLMFCHLLKASLFSRNGRGPFFFPLSMEMCACLLYAWNTLSCSNRACKSPWSRSFFCCFTLHNAELFSLSAQLGDPCIHAESFDRSNRLSPIKNIFPASTNACLFYKWTTRLYDHLPLPAQSMSNSATRFKLCLSKYHLLYLFFLRVVVLSVVVRFLSRDRNSYEWEHYLSSTVLSLQ